MERGKQIARDLAELEHFSGRDDHLPSEHLLQYTDACDYLCDLSQEDRAAYEAYQASLPAFEGKF